MEIISSEKQLITSNEYRTTEPMVCVLTDHDYE